MILLFTDFGLAGPYVGQMKAVLHREAGAVPVLDLMADVPAFDARAGAYLLAAYAADFPAGSVFLCVVDPGVGGDRQALMLQADGRWFVGPDNGLLAVVARRARQVEAWRITWQPEHLSASFHGRDLFAPLAARLARGEPPPGTTVTPDRLVGHDWPDDLAAIVYVDSFGNAMTGLRAERLTDASRLVVRGQRLERARTFSAVAPGDAFWYENANGLAEIAVNQGRADQRLGLAVGDLVEIEPVDSR